MSGPNLWYIEAWMREYHDWQAANPRRSLFAFPLEWFHRLCHREA